MSFCFSKTIKGTFDETIEKITEELKEVGFGILTEVNIKETLKKKLDVDFREYKILGVCNPLLAYQALQAEDKIGLLLPCKVILQEKNKDEVEVAILDPASAMQIAGENSQLREVAEQAGEKLKRVIENL